jgi:uncharacterized membrane protein
LRFARPKFKRSDALVAGGGTGAGIAFLFHRAHRTGDAVVPQPVIGIAFALIDNKLPLPVVYQLYRRRWLSLGWPALLGVLILFYLMVAKPEL